MKPIVPIRPARRLLTDPFLSRRCKEIAYWHSAQGQKESE